MVDLIELIYPRDPDKFSTLYVVMEYLKTDMKKLIKSSCNLDITQTKHIIYNLICAVKYLHESNVLHRDLKPANVLIKEDCTVKLCDFGLARTISRDESTKIYV